MPGSLAAVWVPDWITLGALVLFALWGAMRGTLRQIGMLAVAACGIPLASRFGPGLEGAVRKVVTVDGDDVVLLAWAAAYIAVLVVGGVLLAILQPLLERVKLPGGRGLAALLGVAHGAVLLVVVCLGLLFAFDGPDAAPWVRTLAASRTAGVARDVGRRVEGALPLPTELRRRLRPPARSHAA